MRTPETSSEVDSKKSLFLHITTPSASSRLLHHFDLLWPLGGQRQQGIEVPTCFNWTCDIDFQRTGTQTIKLCNCLYPKRVVMLRWYPIGWSLGCITRYKHFSNLYLPVFIQHITTRALWKKKNLHPNWTPKQGQHTTEKVSQQPRQPYCFWTSFNVRLVETETCGSESKRWCNATVNICSEHFHSRWKSWSGCSSWRGSVKYLIISKFCSGYGSFVNFWVFKINFSFHWLATLSTVPFAIISTWY